MQFTKEQIKIFKTRIQKYIKCKYKPLIPMSLNQLLPILHRSQFTNYLALVMMSPYTYFNPLTHPAQTGTSSSESDESGVTPSVF